MPSGNDDGGFDRRRMLKYLGAGSAAGLAGCSGGGGDGGDDPTPTDTPTDTTTDETTDGTPTQAPPPDVSGTFTAASTSTAGAPHGYFVDDTTTAARLDKLMDTGGFALGPETFAPQTFESWEINDSFDVVDIKLREGLTFGAGYGEYTAEDIMFSLNEIMLLTGEDDWFGFTDTQFYQLGEENELISFEKTGTYSIRAELPVSKPQWLHETPFTAQYFYPKSLLEPYVQNQDVEGIETDSDIVEGAIYQGEEYNMGPYNFVQREQGSNWQFSRNSNYYLKEAADEEPWASDPYYRLENTPYFENYNYQQFDDQSTALSAFDDDQVTSVGLPQADINTYLGQEGNQIFRSQFDNGVFWLNINHRINGWEALRDDPNHNIDDRKVRQAIAELYDQQTIINEINNGFAVPLNTFHPSWGPFYPPDDSLYIPEGSAQRAKSLLQEAFADTDYGYDEQARLVRPNGEQVTLNTVRTVGSESTEAAAEFMLGRLRNAGIEAELASAQWQTLLGNYAANSANNVEGVDEPDFNIGFFNGGPWNQATSSEDWSLMFGLGFSTSPYAPWSAIRSTMTEQGTFNLWGYHQEEFDIGGTIAEASTASDPQTTQDLMTELFAFLSQDMPVVWTQSGYPHTAYQPDVVNFPGEATDFGWEATSFFKSPDDIALGFASE